MSSFLNAKQRMLRILGIALPVLLCAAPAAAQSNSHSSEHRNDCRLAEQVLATGQPSTHAVWAGSAILMCGPDTYTRAAVAGLHRLRSTADTAALHDLWGRALLDVNSQAVFDEAFSIAQDRHASLEARGFAFAGLLQMLRPNDVFTFSTLTNTEHHGRFIACSAGRTAGVRQWVIGAPVSESARERLRAAARSVLDDASAPAAVRAAAYCASRG
jgi:hypothetical protein